jgi:hypothetical protein
MNCDECREQVLDLIEREAADPEAVRELLARCPECRALFDEAKATLPLAEQLPFEEPPAELDAPILRAARARAPKVVPLKKRRLQAPPWAMAAIPLLAVGVGVWTIPRQVQFEGDAGPAVHAPAEEVLAEQTHADRKSMDDANAPALERVEPEARKGASTPRRAKRRTRAPSDDLRVAGVAQAPASVATANLRVDAAEESEAQDLAARASAPEKKDERSADADVATTCKQRVDEVERRAKLDEDFTATPEEELAIGRCYQELANAAEARKWLERAATHRKTRARAESALRALKAED